MESKKLGEFFKEIIGKIRKNEVEYLRKKWGFEKLLNKLEEDDFDIHSLESVADYFCKMLEEIILNKAEYYNL